VLGHITIHISTTKRLHWSSV